MKKSTIFKILQILVFICMIGGGISLTVVSIVVRFSHPEFTETMIFLSLIRDYNWCIFLIAGGFILNLICMLCND